MLIQPTVNGLWGANSLAHSSDLPTPGDSTPTVLARRHWSGHQALLGASCRTTADGGLRSTHRPEDLARPSHRTQKKKKKKKKKKFYLILSAYFEASASTTVQKERKKRKKGERGGEGEKWLSQAIQSFVVLELQTTRKRVVSVLVAVLNSPVLQTTFTSTCCSREQTWNGLLEANRSSSI